MAGQVTSIVLQACIYTVYVNTCLKNVPHFVMLLRNVLVKLGLEQIEKPLAGGVNSDSPYHLILILRRLTEIS
jgi:hypothetical protein